MLYRIMRIHPDGDNSVYGEYVDEAEAREEWAILREHVERNRAAVKASHVTIYELYIDDGLPVETMTV